MLARRRHLAAACGALALAAACTAPAALARAPVALSAYEWTDDPTALDQQGCAAGALPENGLVILDFGRQARLGGRNGTLDFGGNFDRNRDIVAAVEAYAAAYWRCLPLGSTASISLALGTNNSCSNEDPNCCPHGCRMQPVSFNRSGRAWAHRVDELRADLAEMGVQHVRISAADDIEPAWDPAYSATFRFLRGWSHTNRGRYLMRDFGSLEPGWWTPAQERFVAAGFRGARALPEVYYHGMAAEWAALASWAVQAGGRRVRFSGVTSQWSSGHPECGYAPRVGATRLRNALAADPATAVSGFKYITDFRCATPVGGAVSRAVLAGRPADRAVRAGTPASLGGVPSPAPSHAFAATSRWQAVRGAATLVVEAGRRPSSGRGALLVSAVDRRTGLPLPGSGLFPAPPGTPALQLVGVHGPTVSYRSARGAGTFDLVSGRFAP